MNNRRHHPATLAVALLDAITTPFARKGTAKGWLEELNELRAEFVRKPRQAEQLAPKVADLASALGAIRQDATRVGNGSLLLACDYAAGVLQLVQDTLDRE